MDVVVQRCAGLDVHRDNVVATTRVPGSGRRRVDQQTRTFRSTLAGLAELAAWLTEAGVTLVGMEATGVYWKTVFQALEDRFGCWLLSAQHLRNVAGRTTDVKDSEWICQLVQHGLVRPSFVPPPEIRRLRDLTRLRTAQTNERARTIQRLEKVLQDAGIKLSSVASTSYSKSARAMLEALLCGVTDPEQLAQLSKARMRTKIPRLREALQSRFQIEHHGNSSRAISRLARPRATSSSSSRSWPTGARQTHRPRRLSRPGSPPACWPRAGRRPSARARPQQHASRLGHRAARAARRRRRAPRNTSPADYGHPGDRGERGARIPRLPHRRARPAAVPACSTASTSRPGASNARPRSSSASRTNALIAT
jgi:Transposase